MNKVYATFTVPGDPVPKARPRINTTSHRAYTPVKTKKFEELVKIEYLRSNGKKTETGAVVLGVLFKMPIPVKTKKVDVKKMISGKILPTKRPDLDNLVKSILDGLNGVAYLDDNQVVEINAKKVYSETPETVVTLSKKN